MLIVARVRKVVDPVVTATVNFYYDNCLDRATVIAYFGLLSFLPLAVFLVSIAALALGADAAQRGTERFLANILYRMPPGLMTQVQLLQTQIWSGVGYLLLVLWTASKAFSKIEDSLDYVFGVPQRRHYATRKFLAFGLVGLMSIVLVATVVVEGLLSTVDRFIETSALAPLKDAALYQGLNTFFTRTMLPWSLTVLAFFFVYWLMPAIPIPSRVALVGGMVVGTLWTLARQAFIYYIAHLASYTRTYGALATLIVFLLWINLSASLLLWGGELTAVVGGFRTRAEA